MHAVSFHMRRIYEKREVHSKSEAVAKCAKASFARLDRLDSWLMMESRPERSLPDDLFRPSLQAHDRTEVDPNRLPWRVGSQFGVAFFGGAIAVGIIAYLNGKRLSLSRERQRWILAATVLALLLSLAIAGYFAMHPVRMELRVVVRRVFQVVSVALYLVLAWIQRPADRRHQLFEGQYASLWKPGFLALGASLFLTIALGVVAILIFTALRG